uniref:Putative secreted protein n=1 Tax=Ixodes ricinus TaxID=34613 RepID=A0A6B0UMD7_IXORI
MPELTKLLVACCCATHAVKTSPQCVTTHSLLQYSLSQSIDSTAGLRQPLLMQRGGPAGTTTASVGPPSPEATPGVEAAGTGTASTVRDGLAIGAACGGDRCSTGGWTGGGLGTTVR